MQFHRGEVVLVAFVRGLLQVVQVDSRSSSASFSSFSNAVCRRKVLVITVAEELVI